MVSFHCHVSLPEGRRFWKQSFLGETKKKHASSITFGSGRRHFPPSPRMQFLARFEGVQFGITELKDDMILVKCFIATSHDQKNPKFGSFLEGKTPIFQGPKSRWRCNIVPFGQKSLWWWFQSSWAKGTEKRLEQKVPGLTGRKLWKIRFASKKALNNKPAALGFG